ncbi:Gfo/Idh/MocA family protein [Rubinisphaera italica]|uniref:1,5-anhydro-D-fructose reductase n=1 Tax=Rubinisphaera italica TaxID=2527969 RepID=A0A5C5XEL8_9PLAN|nr:Gfo/Idh/MocA family oxidoreductase [Rubinisphaera italica]TWT60773.1 1,5-anhydro-D-fructose reductase [Rubinisphaera italica]
MKQILIIGGGSIGERHVRCFQQTGRARVSLCEMREDLRKDVSERYGLNQCFSSLDKTLQNAAFDAAVICTPANMHIPMALDLAAAGCGMLIEKPLSTSPQGTEQLQAAISSAQLPVSVAYVLRQHPALQSLKKSVDEGRFGRPVQIVFVGGQHFPYYRPAYREIYYTRHETGGGAIQDALTHMVNAAEWIVGPITRLSADAEHCVLDGVDVEDTVHMMTRHGDVLGSFSLNQHQPPNESTLTVICENGAARYEAHHCRWLSCTEPGSEWTVEETFQIERDDLFMSQAEGFLNQLDGNVDPACSINEAIQTLRVNLAALESVRTARWVNI